MSLCHFIYLFKGIVYVLLSTISLLSWAFLRAMKAYCVGGGMAEISINGQVDGRSRVITEV